MIAGVDGCKRGWFVVLREGKEVFYQRACSFAEVIKITHKAQIVTIDIPIGLLNEYVKGGRECEIEARKKLGWPRSSSVFSAPVRKALCAKTHKEAKEIGIKLTIQAFSIMSKIKEVDDSMTPELQNKIKEVHPELCFYGMENRPMKHRKKSSEGVEERLVALEIVGWRAEAEDALRRCSKMVAKDDILDAYAACWTAGRIAEGKAWLLPLKPPVDSKGLRMELWY